MTQWSSFRLRLPSDVDPASAALIRQRISGARAIQGKMLDGSYDKMNVSAPGGDFLLQERGGNIVASGLQQRPQEHFQPKEPPGFAQEQAPISDPSFEDLSFEMDSLEFQEHVAPERRRARFDFVKIGGWLFELKTFLNFKRRFNFGGAILHRNQMRAAGVGGVSTWTLPWDYHMDLIASSVATDGVYISDVFSRAIALGPDAEWLCYGWIPGGGDHTIWAWKYDQYLPSITARGQNDFMHVRCVAPAP